MTNPSPPLLPGPPTINTSRGRGFSLRSSSAALRPAFSMSTTPGTPYSWIARRSRSRTSARDSQKGVMGLVYGRSAASGSPADAQAPALDQGVHLGHRQPGEVARDRVLESTHRRPVGRGLLQVAVQETVQETGH